MTAATIVQRARAGAIMLLVALSLLLSALPASADPKPGNGPALQNISWESTLHNLTWE